MDDNSKPEFDVVRAKLRALITPMVISLLLTGSTSIVDTFYLSFLGDNALAAFSFMMPVLIGANQLCIGYGIGVTSVIARALGASDRPGVARLTSHTLVVALVLATLLAAVLLGGQSAMFRGLGATHVERPLMDAFMTWWIPGVLLFVPTAWGTAILRGLGETRSTALVMLAQALVNLVLAPILMFGLAGLPAMGMAGAGLALTIGAAFSLALTGWFLAKRRDAVAFSLSARRFLESARTTLSVALPAILTYALVPATTAVFTHWLASYGADAVAAFGIAVRFESFIVMVPLAIGAGLGPFVGQCWGARRLDEVRFATVWCSRIARTWGLSMTILLAVLAVPLGHVLADHPALAAKIPIALWTVPLGFASYGGIVVASSVYNNIGRASRTASFALLRTIVLAIPIGAIAQYAFGFVGLYAALPIASFITERYAVWRLRRDELWSQASGARVPGLVRAG